MQRYIFILNNKGKYVEMSPNCTSKDFGDSYKDFAHSLGLEYKWTDVKAFRLYEDQNINGLYYLEDFYPDGVEITFLRHQGFRNEDIEKAKEKLLLERDVVQIKVIEIDLMLQNIAIQTEDELTLLCTFSNMERAKKITQRAGIDVKDMFDVREDELKYYFFDGITYDTNLAKQF